MANKRFWLGMLVMALVFGMTVIGCDNGTTGNGTDPALNGTWQLTMMYDIPVEELIYKEFLPEGYQAETKFNNGNYETFMNGTPMSQATYTTSGNQITITPTRLHGDYLPLMGIELESKLYSKNELKAALIALGQDDEDIEFIDVLFSLQQTYSYSVNGNTLTITTTITYEDEGETQTVTQTVTYTRKN